MIFHHKENRRIAEAIQKNKNSRISHNHIKVFADNIDTTKPTAPKGKSWGEWIMEINKFDANKWQVSANGVILKDCGGESPLISIDSKTGIMHFNPSTLPSDNALCKGLGNSYKSKSGSGDKKIPL